MEWGRLPDAHGPLPQSVSPPVAVIVTVFEEAQKEDEPFSAQVCVKNPEIALVVSNFAEEIALDAHSSALVPAKAMPLNDVWPSSETFEAVSCQGAQVELAPGSWGR